MKDFFTFYKDIQGMQLPFEAFSLIHIGFLAISYLIIMKMYRYYSGLNVIAQRRFQIRMAIDVYKRQVTRTLYENTRKS